MMEAEPGHLSDQDLERYRGQGRPRAELLALDDHLAACEDCSARLWSGAESTEVFDLIEMALAASPDISTEHLTYEQMACLADEQVTGEDRDALSIHLAECHQCSMEVTDLRRDRSLIEGRRGEAYGQSRRGSTDKTLDFRKKRSGTWEVWSRPAIQLAAAAVLVLSVGLGTSLVMRSRVAALESRIADLVQQNHALAEKARATQDLENELAEARRESDALHQEPTLPGQAVVSLNDGPGRITMAMDGSLTGLDFLNRANRDEVKAALTGQRVKIPTEIASLVSGTGTLMGADGDQASYGLLQPLGTAVRSDRPAFRWREVPGAGNYEVNIYRAGFNEVATSGPLNKTAWTPNAPLERGQVYTWQVVAVIDDKQVVLPPPAAPRAKFKILDQSAFAELERVQRAASNSHLAMGVIYARNGLLDESRREFQALVAANPTSEVAKKLLRAVTSGRLDRARRR
jgi:hypothetical protein